LITFAHFSVSSTMRLPNSAVDPVSNVTPASQGCLDDGIGEASIGLSVELVDDVDGRVLGATMPHHPLAKGRATPAAAWRCVGWLQVSPDVPDGRQHGSEHGEQNDNQDRRLRRRRWNV
jgi:hypothetical protein